MSYFEKYLKYKTKYLQLQNMMGGGKNLTLTNFIKILENEDKLKQFKINIRNDKKNYTWN